MNRMSADAFRKLHGTDKRPAITQAAGRPVRGTDVGRDPVTITEVEVLLEGLPEATNQAYKIVRLAGAGGKQFHKLALTKKAAAYKKYASLVWSSKLLKRDADHYAVQIVWFVPDFKNGKPRRIDIDGMVKQALDAAFGTLGIDDAKVVKLDVSKVGIAPHMKAMHAIGIMVLPSQESALEPVRKKIAQVAS